MIRKKPLDADDERLWAYALGDLSDEDSAKFDALIAESPEARETVNELRRLADSLQQALDLESQGHDGLGGDRCAAIAAALAEQAKESTSKPPRLEMRRSFFPWGVAAAASLLVLVLLSHGPRPSKNSETPAPEVAANSNPKRSPKSLIDRRNVLADASLLSWRAKDYARTQDLSQQILRLDSKDVQAKVLFAAALTAQGQPKVTTVPALAAQDPAIVGATLRVSPEPDPMDTSLEASTLRLRPGELPIRIPSLLFVTGEQPQIPQLSLGVAVDAYAFQSPHDHLFPNVTLGDRNFASWTYSGTPLIDGFSTPSRGYTIDLRSITPGALHLGRTGIAHAGWNSGESYEPIAENPFRRVAEAPLSTFALDVDTGSYANVRRILQQGALPPRDAVRIEEFINYFDYEDPAPVGDIPLGITLEAATCPWDLDHRLVRIGIRGKEIPKTKRPSSNLVFLVDVSGSMQPQNRLPLLKTALAELTKTLEEKDRVAIVTYATNASVALESTSCFDTGPVLSAIASLSAGGSTNGAAGLDVAYTEAARHFIPGGINRVLVCTDGDFNVGMTSKGDLVNLIQEKAKSGVFLSVLGFGEGNLKESNLEQIADRGNGHYAYIDSLAEGRKVLVQQAGTNLLTIAKDVKLQIEFNPATVGSWRLIGFENRALAHRDFNDDRKDGGELGSGATATALYEIAPAGSTTPAPDVDPLKYSQATPPAPKAAAKSGDLLTLKLRYKEPEGQVSRKLEVAARATERKFDDASADLRFAAAVASFGMILRGSEHRGTATVDMVLEIAEGALGSDPHQHRRGFVDLVRRTLSLGEQ